MHSRWRLFAGLSLLCAGTLASSDVPSLSPGPSGTGSSSLAGIVDGTDDYDNWYGLLRRNMGQMLEKRMEGVRETDEVKNLDLEAWATETVKRCVAKLNSTTVDPATNPAGVAGCWNIPVLVANTGVFAADLRLFRVADPTGDWVDVPISAYNISLEYHGSAAIQPRALSEKERKASQAGMPEDTTLVRLIDSQFIGNLDQSLLSEKLSDTKLKVMVTPDISIRAFTRSGKAVNTTVNIAASQFVNGVFADTPALTAEEADQVKAAPFKLPGTRLEVIPAGLYFFSAYLLVACSIFGWGTLERAKFRDQYRKRIAMQGFR